jgi:eukaryotic-like serine/threonine-protein kinase
VRPLKEIREAFSKALQTPAAELDSLLATLPEDLRAEIVSLLSAHGSAGRFLDFSESATQRSGERIGPYVLAEEIGHGGMGVVYRAVRDDGEFRRQVAIKLVGGRLFLPEAERRFIGERRILALLDHPNIVRMIDGGIAQGQRYLVMEFIAGLPVTEYCAAHSLPMAERLRLFQSICSAIQYAHQRLIIHRDLKPRNILVTSEGQVKVLDFGIARLLDEGPGGDATTALHPMTLTCASPEQLRDDVLTLASDIYSLGVLLYELLTGQNPQSTGTRSEIMQRIATADPLPPGKLAPGISPDLDAIVLKALAKEPERRYASAEEMSADVGRFLGNRPVIARRPSRLYSAARFCARNKALTTIAAALVLAVLGGAATTLAQSRRAERRFDEVRSLAHSFLFEVYDSISALPGSVPARQLVVGRAQRYLESLSREAAGDSTLSRELAESYLRLGDVRGSPFTANLGDTPGALQSYEEARKLLEQDTGRHPNDAAGQERLCQVYMSLGRLYIRQARPGLASDVLHRAIAVAEGLCARYPAEAAYRDKLSRAYTYLGEAQTPEPGEAASLPPLRQALSFYRKSIEIQQSGAPRSDPSSQLGLSSNYFHIGFALRVMGDITGETSYYQQALDSELIGYDINQKLVASHPEHPMDRIIADCLTNIAMDRWKCCRDQEGSLRDSRQALATFQKIANADPLNQEAQRDLADSYQNVGYLLAQTGRRDEALDATRTSLAMRLRIERADPTSRYQAEAIPMLRARIAELERSPQVK